MGPSMAAAHPHVFVDTGLRIVLDDAGYLRGVEVSWTYDALYSLLTFEDLALDPDYNGVLEAEELAKLDGFDLAWAEGFEGDLFLEKAGVKLTLGPPEGRGVAVGQDGRISSRHFRPLADPLLADGVVLRAFDPGFYTAYDLTGGVEVSGACVAQITPADLDAAYTLVEELLYALPTDQVEEAFPKVGAAFADRVELTCNA